MPKSTKDIYRELLAQDNNQYGGLRGANAGQTVTANQVQDTGGAMGSALRGTSGGTDWNAMMEDYYNQIQNRPGFSYDPKNDAMYQSIKDLYVNQGRRAMEDTMGQAAGLTGGYGSSYGQAVGNQAYNDYLTKLNAEIPGLYAQARAGYDADTADLYNKYNLALQGANLQYAHDRDALADQRYDQEYADQQAYQQWQMNQTTQGNARDLALMMLQTGKVPSADLLNQAGISAADAAALAKYYASLLAGKTGSGGGTKYVYVKDPQTDPTTDPTEAGKSAYDELSDLVKQYMSHTQTPAGYKAMRDKILNAKRAGQISNDEGNKLLAAMKYSKEANKIYRDYVDNQATTVN